MFLLCYHSSGHPGDPHLVELSKHLSDTQHISFLSDMALVVGGRWRNIGLGLFR